MTDKLDRIVQPARPVDAQNKDPFTEEVIVAWQASMSQREIARTLGISRYRVRQIADQHGLEFDATMTETATRVHAERAQKDRAELEARFAALAHTELDKAEESDDDQSRYIHIRNAAISADKSVALADSANRLDLGADAAEEGKRLVSIQMGLMTSQADRVRQIMDDPTPGKKQPGLWSIRGMEEDDEPP